MSVSPSGSTSGMLLLAPEAHCSLARRFNAENAAEKHPRSPVGAAEEIRYRQNSPFMRLPWSDCQGGVRSSTLVSDMLRPVEQGLCAALAAAGLAAGGWFYASLWPGSRIFGRAVTAPARPRELALTFDDGPNPAWTPRLLDLLAEHGVRATFFMLGMRAQSEAELVRRAVSAGHVVGNHSWSHPNLARSSAARVREELKRTQETLQQIAGAPVRWFRPPYGARRPAVFRIAREMGLEPVLWNAMTTDWSEPSAERIAMRLEAKIDGLERRGSAANIVLHDGNHRERSGDRGPSIAAAGLLLKRYGGTHRFVTVEQWAEAAGSS